MCLDKKGFYCAATKYYEISRELTPYLGRPIVRLAEIYFNRNDLDSVLRLLEPFCRTKHHVKAASTLAKSYMKMGLNNIAIDTCSHFINNTKSIKDKSHIQKLKLELESID
jgi:outer membrane protein assembly factor BamD (BamD/ComL family)